ncbi:hypothetical protein CRENBAI_026428 [Crenichthys baileyi]|uniref:Uncharacterized protein n=1 Tax=Crenichthys baileyi TaxID=28760 RepID=A0AAV9S2T0_9TELE
MERSNNAASVTIPGFTRYSRDGASLECTTTFSRSSIWMTFAFSGTSVYPGPSLRTCCPALGDESASGTPTAGAADRLPTCLRISFLSLVKTRLSSHSFPQLHSALNSEFNSEAKMLGFFPPIGRSASLGVYGAVGWPRLARTLSFCMMIG